MFSISEFPLHLHGIIATRTRAGLSLETFKTCYCQIRFPEASNIQRAAAAEEESIAGVPPAESPIGLAAFSYATLGISSPCKARGGPSPSYRRIQFNSCGTPAPERNLFSVVIRATRRCNPLCGTDKDVPARAANQAKGSARMLLCEGLDIQPPIQVSRVADGRY